MSPNSYYSIGKNYLSVYNQNYRGVINKLTYTGCHCEPFAYCHSERSEESLMPWLRVNSVR